MAPWDFDIGLRPERLVTVAKLLRKVRAEALELHNEALGDDSWSLGCRAYAWSRNRIIWLAGSGRAPWLKIINSEGLQLLFAVGNVPVKFLRGDPDEPPAKILRNAEAELAQLSLPLRIDHEPLIWRMVVDAEADGSVRRVVLLGLGQSGSTYCFWEIPTTDEKDIALESRSTIADDAVELDEPDVALRPEADEDAG